MRLRRRTKPLARLQWKLLFSYTLVTALAIFLGGVLLIVVIAMTTQPTQDLAVHTALVYGLSGSAEELAPLLEQNPPDHAALATWLEGATQGEQLRLGPDGQMVFRPVGEVKLALVDRAGRVLAANTADTPPDTLLAEQLPSNIASVLQAALGGNPNPARLYTRQADGRESVAVPLFGAQDQILGALFLSLARETGPRAVLRSAAGSLAPLALTIMILASLLGALLGLPTARWLTGRLRALSEATQAWGQGDFSVVAQDPSDDELGQLGRHLNRMAERIQNLMHARERLATLEERNRLARDLHDSVTQSLYSVTLYAEAAARQLDAGQLDVARAHVRELGETAQQALREMRLLVYELRPPILERKGLVAALQARLEAVEKRAGIDAQFCVEGYQRLPFELESDLYRIAQEALNNALKHAHAHRVAVRLVCQGPSLLLEIADDGQGLDPDMTRAQGGLGLQSMEERAAKLGGRLSVNSQPGQGTQIRVEVNR